MKRIVFLFAVFLIPAATVGMQCIEEGKLLYEQEKYKQVILVMDSCKERS